MNVALLEDAQYSYVMHPIERSDVYTCTRS